MWETGTNSPDISCDFQLVLRGRLVAAPTDASSHKQQLAAIILYLIAYRIVYDFIAKILYLRIKKIEQGEKNNE